MPYTAGVGQRKWRAAGTVGPELWKPHISCILLKIEKKGQTLLFCQNLLTCAALQK
jgi:hypothetical protein